MYEFFIFHMLATRITNNINWDRNYKFPYYVILHMLLLSSLTHQIIEICDKRIALNQVFLRVL